MLRGKHAVGQRLRRVAGKDRDFDLPEHLTRIELLGDEMHGAAAVCVAGSEARVMGIEPRYLGSRDGWMLRIRPSQRSTNQAKMRMNPASAMCRRYALRVPR